MIQSTTGNRIASPHGGKKEYVGSAGETLGSLLVLPHPVIKVNRKLKHPNPGWMEKGTDPSGMKLWVTLPGKEPRTAGVLDEGKGNTEWVVEKGSYKYQPRPCDQFLSYFSRMCLCKYLCFL